MRRTLAAVLVSGVAVASAVLSSAQQPLKHWVPIQLPGTPISAPATTPQLQYYGGPVISNVVTVSVLWGSGVDAEVAAAMPSFLSDVPGGTYMDWLCEYNTAGHSGTTTNQVIGRGTFGGQFTITPQNTHTSLLDTDVQSELANQLTRGHLPQPLYDPQGYPLSLYVIEFPPGVSIALDSQTLSCQAFCAYHSAMYYHQKPLLYTVQPDFGPGSGCDLGCGQGNMLQNQQSTHSHEIIEAVTDPEVSFASTYGPPLGWYDPQGNDGEIGDICNAQQGQVIVNDRTYTVQTEWSNRLNNCVAGDPYLASAPTIGGTSSASVGGTISLAASGGTAPYEWVFNPGSGEQLVTGQTGSALTITPATLSNAGNYSVISNGACTLQSAQWPVRVCPAITLSPATLPGLIPGVPYGQTITASGGTAPYTFAVTSGALPGGLALSTGGSLSGTTSASGTSNFTVTATASDGCAGSQAYSLTAVNPPEITSVRKASPPFKLVVTGSNLQDGIKVYIDGAQWSSVVWKNTTKLLLTGAIKTAIPKGATRTLLFVNPDGGEASTTFSW